MEPGLHYRLLLALLCQPVALRSCNPSLAERSWQKFLLGAQPWLAESPVSGVTGGILEQTVTQETLFLENHGLDSSTSDLCL